MKRASVLRVLCGMIGTSVSSFGCSSDTNPTIPPGGPTSDGGLGERYLMVSNDVAHPSAYDATSANKDARAGSDADAAAVDAGQGALVRVTILGLIVNGGVDGGANSGSTDGGATVVTIDDGAGPAIVIDKSGRFAPTVRVEVESQGGDPLADLLSSVRAALVTPNSTTVVASAALNQTQYGSVPESDSKVYIFADSPLDLSKVSGDFYDLQIAAATAGGSVAVASVRIFLDAGPTITFLQPADKSYVKGSIMVTAVVADKHAEVAEVRFSIGQSQIDPNLITSRSGQYTVALDFGSYNPPLDGDQLITVTATNSLGITSLASRKFTIDNNGPVISSTKPATGALIGKVITIEAKVDDPAGVMSSSVVAVVAHGDIHFEVKLIKGTDGIYRQIFDTTQLPIYAIFPSISFRAQDILGNQSAVGYLVSLDNTPPIMDLDPPDDFRLYKKGGTCSWPFDPVGPDAIDDGSVVTQMFDIRARIEDEGNRPITGTFDFDKISTIDPASVHLLILDDTSLPLVVDTSDPPDGICDDINPDLVPSVSPQSSKEAQLVGMVPMPANSGSGDFTPQPGSYCSGDAPKRPDPLCDTTYSWAKGEVMTYSLGYSDGLSAIWTIGPVVSNDLECAGRQFDASNNLSDGWACVAVEASDKMGNKQVSRPLRICVVVTPGSKACTTAGMGGVEVTRVALPSSSLGDVVVDTGTPLLGNGGVALKQGDTVTFSDLSVPYTAVNGTHAVSPQGTGGTSFMLANLSPFPAQLWVEKLDGTELAFKGEVGLIAQKNAEVQLVTDRVGTSLAADFAGLVIVVHNGLPPEKSDRRWAVHDILPTGFKLKGSDVQLSGLALASSRIPNCTGTATKQTSGVVVDATKPCLPWRSFARQGYLILR